MSWEEARRQSLAGARRFTSDPHEAEDIAQQALLSAWRHRAALRDPRNFPGWMASIVRNEAIRQVDRRRRATAGVALLADTGCEDDAIARTEEAVDLTRAFEVLDSHERLLLKLRYDDDLTQRAVAEHLGLPEGTVKVQLHRARAKLHRALSQT